jgi:hypothetical protein
MTDRTSLDALSRSADTFDGLMGDRPRQHRSRPRRGAPSPALSGRAILLATVVIVSGWGLLPIAPAGHALPPFDARHVGRDRPIVTTLEDRPTAAVPPPGWADVSPMTGPSPRWQASMTYDTADGYVLLFGGSSASATSAQTWSYSNGSWTLQSPFFPPAARSEASMVYDAQDGYVLLFGGRASNGRVLGDTWKYVGGTWTNLTGGLTKAPSPRFGASIVDDASDGYVLLIGGEAPNGSVLDDAWSFHAGLWTLLGHFPQVPSFQGGMTFDASDNYVLAFGGGNATGAGANSTWTYKAGVWSELDLSEHPGARTDESLGFDPKDGYVVLFGGANGTALLNDTWKFAHNNWYPLRPSVSPGARAFAGALPYDASDGYLLLFGGGWYATPAFGDTWSYGATPPTALFACASFGGPNQSACAYSEYGKYFLANVSGVNDVFGVVATDNATLPSSVTATLAGSPLSFSSVPSSPGAYNSSSVAMGALRPGAALSVQVTFPTTPVTTVNLSLPIDVVWTPSWLQSIANSSGGFQLSEGRTGAWNNPYNLTASYSFSAGGALSAVLPSSIPASLLSGTYQDIPSLLWHFEFASSGQMTMRSALTTNSIPITLGEFTGTGEIGGSGSGGSPGSVGIAVYFEAGASGRFHVQGVQLELQSASATLGLGFNVSFQIPVPVDYGFSVGACSFNFGIAPVVEFGTGVAITFDLAPAPKGTPSGLLLPGIGLEITGVEGVTLMLSFGLEAVASIEVCDLNVASLTLGGQVGVNLFVQPTPLAVSGGNLYADVTWSACVLSFCAGGTLWSGSDSWGNQSSGADPGRSGPSASPPANWTLLPRASYNVSQYLQTTWSPGERNGTLVPIFYPESESAMAATGGAPYYLYDFDNVSRNESVGMELGGLSFAGPNGSVGRLPGPPTSGTVPSDPALLTLPDGDLQATWDALPDSEAVSGNPSTWTFEGFDTATYDPSTGSWGAARALTSSGVATDAALDLCGTTPYALLLLDSPSNGTQSLVEFDLASGAVTGRTSVQGLASLDGFDCATSLASVTYEGGGGGLLTLSSGKALALTAPTGGYTLERSSIVEGATGLSVALMGNRSAGQLLLVNDSGGRSSIVATGALPANASDVEAVETPAGPVAAVELYHAIELLVESNGHWQSFDTIPYGAIQGYDVAFDGNALDLAVRVNRGSPTVPEVSLAMSRVSFLPVAVSSASVLDAGEAVTFSAAATAIPDVSKYLWTGLPPVAGPPVACPTEQGVTIVCTLLPGNYTVGVDATLPSGASFPSRSLSILVHADPSVAVRASATTARAGTTVHLTAAPLGGTLPYTYVWRVNGSIIASGPNANVNWTVPRSGSYVITVEIEDAAGVSSESGPLVVSTPAPSSIPWTVIGGAVVAFVVASLIMAGVVVWYRGRRKGPTDAPSSLPAPFVGAPPEGASMLPPPSGPGPPKS